MKSVSEISRAVGSSKNSPGSPSAKLKFPKAFSIATALSLSTLLGLAACNSDYTLGFVYAPSGSLTAGLINAYRIDNQTGYLHLLEDSPIPSGGRKASAIAAAPNHEAVYVVNHDDSNVVALTIGTDGKLYPQATYNTTGSFPTAVVVSADGKFLYLPYTYQNGFTTASPGPGGITVFPINSDNTLGTALDFPIGRTPIAIAVSNKPVGNGGNVVYVVAQDAAAVNPAASQTSDQTLNLFAFATDASTGALSLLPGETIVSTDAPSLGYATGIAPGGILEDASGTHLYVTDSTGNIVISYSIAANGVPSLIANGTAPTGSQPMGMTIDPTGKYFYVANYNSGTVGGYTFASNGAPVVSAAAASTQAGTGTTCVTIEPSHGIYLYTSGSLSNSITGEEIIPADGSLKPIINSPYAATTLPECTVAVPRF